jgi:hypothetical protein
MEHHESFRTRSSETGSRDAACRHDPNQSRDQESAMTLRNRFCAAMIAVSTLAACGGVDASGPPAQYSPTLYEGACPLIAIEETPDVVGHEQDDSLALAVRYRVGEMSPWELVSQLARSDTHDTRFELQGHAIALCTPKPAATAASAGQ